MFGIGNFNHGFRTPSSIFYLNSLYYLPYINFFFFHMGSILIMGFVNIILLKNFMILNLKNKFYIFFYFIVIIIYKRIFLQNRRTWHR